MLARLAVALIARLGEYPLAQMSISLAVPYASFMIADDAAACLGRDRGGGGGDDGEH